MKTLTALLLLASLFIIENLFAGTPFDDDTKKDSLVKRSIVQIPVDSIIDIDSLLNDTTLFKVVSDTLINNDSLKTDSIINVPSDTIVTKKTDTISKHIPKKPVVVIPQSVIKLNKIYSDYRKYSDFAQDRWDDIYLSLSEINMKSDYYKFVVPLTYYSEAFEEATSLDGWYPKDIIVEDSVRKVSILQKGMPDMPVSSELDKRINRQLLDF